MLGQVLTHKVKNKKVPKKLAERGRRNISRQLCRSFKSFFNNLLESFFHCVKSLSVLFLFFALDLHHSRCLLFLLLFLLRKTITFSYLCHCRFFIKYE